MISTIILDIVRYIFAEIFIVDKCVRGKIWSFSMSAHQLWFCITNVRLPHMWLTQRLFHNCEVTSIVARLPLHLWGCLNNHDTASPVHTWFPTFESTSHVRQPHLFWGCFPPPKVTLSVVKLHNSCKAVTPIGRSPHQFWNCDTGTSCEAASK